MQVDNALYIRLMQNIAHTPTYLLLHYTKSPHATVQRSRTVLSAHAPPGVCELAVRVAASVRTRCADWVFVSKLWCIRGPPPPPCLPVRRGPLANGCGLCSSVCDTTCARHSPSEFLVAGRRTTGRRTTLKLWLRPPPGASCASCARAGAGRGPRAPRPP